MMTYDKFANLTGTDLEGFHSGGDTEAWKRLGAHIVSVHDDKRGTIQGTRFTVWAPNAKRVQILGDFNWWQGDDMELIPGSGVWGLWKENVKSGALYKYKIQHTDGTWQEKADPFAFSAQIPPLNASAVFASEHQWAESEEKWLSHRANFDPTHEQVSIYELHIGSWRKGLTYRQLAKELPPYLSFMGYTHVEFMPLMAHPLEASWGYQVTGYYAADPRYGSPDDLKTLIEALHAAGIGVILDWVPGHFPKDDWALGRFDGTALFEHADPRRGEQLDWGTYVFNYGRNEVKSFLVSNALYWVSEFHIDGLRFDAVASMLYLDYSRPEGGWLPNKYGGRENLEAIDFLRYVNTHLYERQPGIMMIAEESTSFPGVTAPVDRGGLGFGFKWNMGWMNDSLEYLQLDPIYRQYNRDKMTFAMVYAYSENYILPISHDEVVHGKSSMINKIPQDDWRKFATLRAFYSFMWAFPGKQLLFMGQEFAQRPEWSETRSLEWWVDGMGGHKGLRDLTRELNAVQSSAPALYQQDREPEGFSWINGNDAQANTFSWIRYGKDGSMVACVANFSPDPHTSYGLRVPKAGCWQEILNTDETRWDGTGEYLNGERDAIAADDGDGAWLAITIPPMAGVWLRYTENDSRVSNNRDASSHAASPRKAQ